jgi:hypothetical protein
MKMLVFARGLEIGGNWNDCARRLPQQRHRFIAIPGMASRPLLRDLLGSPARLGAGFSASRCSHNVPGAHDALVKGVQGLFDRYEMGVWMLRRG